MKKAVVNTLIWVVVLYLWSLSVMAPYYNWRYAREHGWVSWLLFGEIVATLKSAAWPYFVLFSHEPGATTSPDERHYINSKTACDEAMAIVAKVGDVHRLSRDDKKKIADLLEVAIAEANQVQPAYLEKVHPQFREVYERKYKWGMDRLMNGLRTDYSPLILSGGYAYNELAEWLRAHSKELSF
jgi:hypothetical protein